MNQQRRINQKNKRIREKKYKHVYIKKSGKIEVGIFDIKQRKT